jgi:formylglycine-generating enzyme required for sulfatase activity
MRYEVTQAEWQAAFGNNPSYFGPSGNGADCGLDCPVDRVNWYEAAAYANWLSAQEGLTQCYLLTNCTESLGGGCPPDEEWCSSGTYTCTVALNEVNTPYECEGYRLPTESEWEYAIRAGTTTAFYNGGITYTGCTLDPNLTQIGWYCGNASSTTHPVGEKNANAWGLHDMSGNVWEWMWDWYVAEYPSGSMSLPAMDPTGAATGSFRVGRGGDWINGAYCSRSARRHPINPGNRYHGVGLRLARSTT